MLISPRTPATASSASVNSPGSVAASRTTSAISCGVSPNYDWCGDAGSALIPYGGGSSVVGGVTSDVDSRFNGTVTVDMSRMNKVLEIDDVSRTARIQGGACGPELEAQLKPSGLTLRHFPQSFEHSTFGGCGSRFVLPVGCLCSSRERKDGDGRSLSYRPAVIPLVWCLRRRLRAHSAYSLLRGRLAGERMKPSSNEQQRLLVDRGCALRDGAGYFV